MLWQVEQDRRPYRLKKNTLAMLQNMAYLQPSWEVSPDVSLPPIEGRTCLMRGCNACLKGHAKDYTTVDKVVVAVAVGLSVVINPSAKTRATPFHFVAGIA